MTNPMREIRIEKVTLNIGIGEVGTDVEKAVTLLERLTGSDAIRTKSKDSAKGFGLREGLEIGAKTTLRGEEAKKILPQFFDGMDYDLSIESFDSTGNFSFSVEEYINIPGVDYDPEIGMQGFDVAVTLERPGFRVKRRQEDKRDIGKNHKITPEEAAEFVQDEFDVEVKGV